MRTVIAALALAPLLAAAQTFAGTKPETSAQPLQSAAAPIGAGNLAQLLIALLIVAALLKLALPRIAHKLSKRISPALGSSLKIEESASFAGGSLYVVSVRDRALLLSASPAGIQMLCDLTPPANAPPEAPTFSEMLAEASDAAPSNPDVNEEALNRIQRLLG